MENNCFSEDQLLPTDSADPIAQAGNGDGNYYPGSGYYPSGGGYEPHEGGYPTGSGYYPTDGGNYPSDGGDHHAGGGYDHDDDDDDLEDELADSLTSIAEAIVLMSKVHPNSLKHFHPSKCQDSYYPAQNNDHGYNGDGDGDRPTYAWGIFFCLRQTNVENKPVLPPPPPPPPRHPALFKTPPPPFSIRRYQVQK